MLDGDEYMDTVRAQLVPIDERPRAMASATNPLLLWYGVYCLAAWIIGALLVWGVVRWLT